MKQILILAIVFLGNLMLSGQTEKIQIIVIDNSNESMPYANVIVRKNGETITQSTTNIEGICTIDSLTPGKLEVEVRYVGYESSVSNIIVKKGEPFHLEAIMTSSLVLLNCVEIVDYMYPMITDCGSSCTRTFHEINCCFGCGISCSEYSTETLKTDSIVNIELPKFNYYPNPTYGQLFVEIDEKAKELFIMDINGKLIQKYIPNGLQKLEIDLNDLSAGTYFIGYLNDSENQTEKLMIVH